MEQLLHYVWKHKLFPLSALTTTIGQDVEVIDPGLHNSNAGPDFFNAKVRINGTLWVGNVELHTKASEWFAHHHDRDTAYNNVVLHVVEEEDNCQAITEDGQKPPQLVLPVPQKVKDNYEELLHTDAYPPCYRIIPNLSRLLQHSWMSYLQTERLQQKTEAIEARAKAAAVTEHRQLETAADAHFQSLSREYTYLAHKFNLTPIDGRMWRFLRLRPQNFPYIRIAQLVNLYCSRQCSLSLMANCQSLDDVRRMLSTGTTPYWHTHYTFGQESKTNDKQLSKASKDVLVINTVVPMLYAYGRHTASEKLCDRAFAFLEQLKAEDNTIVRMWQQCGLSVDNAGDSQALIQLKREYCDKKECLRCRFGYEYLKGKKG